MREKRVYARDIVRWIKDYVSFSNHGVVVNKLLRVALNIEVLRASAGEARLNMEQRRNGRAGETGYPRENPPTSDIVRHDSHMRKSECESNPVRLSRSSNARFHHRGSKLDPRSDLRSTLKTVTPFAFRAGLEIEMKFISNLRKWRFEISIRDQQPSVVSGVVWTNRTMVSSNTDTNRTGVLAVVDIGDSLLICLKILDTEESYILLSFLNRFGLQRITAKAGSGLLEMCFFRRSHAEKEPAPKDISDNDPNRIICWETFPVHEGKADNTAVVSVFGNESMYSRKKMKMEVGDRIWLHQKLVGTTGDMHNLGHTCPPPDLLHHEEIRESSHGRTGERLPREVCVCVCVCVQWEKVKEVRLVLALSVAIHGCNLLGRAIEEVSSPLRLPPPPSLPGDNCAYYCVAAKGVRALANLLRLPTAYELSTESVRVSVSPLTIVLLVLPTPDTPTVLYNFIIGWPSTNEHATQYILYDMRVLSSNAKKSVILTLPEIDSAIVLNVLKLGNGPAMLLGRNMKDGRTRCWNGVREITGNQEEDHQIVGTKTYAGLLELTAAENRPRPFYLEKTIEIIPEFLTLRGHAIRDGASSTEKRDWGRNGKKSDMAFERDTSQRSPGVTGNRTQILQITRLTTDVTGRPREKVCERERERERESGRTRRLHQVSQLPLTDVRKQPDSVVTAAGESDRHILIPRGAEGATSSVTIVLGGAPTNNTGALGAVLPTTAVSHAYTLPDFRLLDNRAG
ncbi:hypothetical protein PR048_033670 [Dryococelus australis]|uniref:Uncharacterized protein n=1 Tax=Dryococelus australis TaxID=614101 RepID=A0ABQ9G551_9NEOP|nr:hypothetical protein PR048_033670 [Dryococelus australis]